MSVNQNRRTRDFSKYDAMSTEELENILRLDSEAPAEQESDTELLLHIMEVLASRTHNSITGNSAFESWKNFQHNYLRNNEEWTESDHTAPNAPAKPRPWMRKLAAIAAVLALVIGLSVTAAAIDWSAVWNTVARWANGTFSFVAIGETDSAAPSSHSIQRYSSLQEALKHMDLDHKQVPTWIPEGYALYDITVSMDSFRNTFGAKYIKDGQHLLIMLNIDLDGNSAIYEVGDEPLEIYCHNGSEFYIFANTDHICAIWQSGIYECSISGELTIEELKTMIDSIGKE